MTPAPSPRPARRLAPIAVACLLVAAGCGDDGRETATSSTTTTGGATASSAPPPPAAPTTGPAGAAAGFDGGTDPVVVAAAPAATAHLVDVRVGAHEGHDRVVLEFDGPLPSVDVRYADGPVAASGSGEAVPVEGGAVLAVRLEPASGVDLSGPTLVETYPGPARVRGGTATVTEVVRTGDFEGVLEWAVGVEERAPFRLSTEASPPRVVIDVAAS